MNTQPYFTIAQAISAELVIERSRFIGHCLETATETEAKAFIGKIREEHSRANHNCFAYRIGQGENPLEYFNDHGEPAGTAGKPILGAIQRLELTNTVVVVTRYFGGKKLGVRGLIDAYGKTATLVLETAGVIQRVPKFIVVLTYDYPQHDLMLHRLQSVQAQVLDTTFTHEVSLKASIPEALRPEFQRLVQDLRINRFDDNS